MSGEINILPAELTGSVESISPGAEIVGSGEKGENFGKMFSALMSDQQKANLNSEKQTSTPLKEQGKAQAELSGPAQSGNSATGNEELKSLVESLSSDLKEMKSLLEELGLDIQDLNSPEVQKVVEQFLQGLKALIAKQSGVISGGGEHILPMPQVENTGELVSKAKHSGANVEELLNSLKDKLQALKTSKENNSQVIQEPSLRGLPERAFLAEDGSRETQKNISGNEKQQSLETSGNTELPSTGKGHSKGENSPVNQRSIKGLENLLSFIKTFESTDGKAIPDSVKELLSQKGSSTELQIEKAVKDLAALVTQKTGGSEVTGDSIVKSSKEGEGENKHSLFSRSTLAINNNPSKENIPLHTVQQKGYSENLPNLEGEFRTQNFGTTVTDENEDSKSKSVKDVSNKQALQQNLTAGGDSQRFGDVTGRQIPGLEYVKGNGKMGSGEQDSTRPQDVSPQNKEENKTNPNLQGLQASVTLNSRGQKTVVQTTALPQDSHVTHQKQTDSVGLKQEGQQDAKNGEGEDKKPAYYRPYIMDVPKEGKVAQVRSLSVDQVASQSDRKSEGSASDVKRDEASVIPEPKAKSDGAEKSEPQNFMSKGLQANAEANVKKAQAPLPSAKTPESEREIIRQISRGFISVEKDGVKEIRLDLKPATLGRVVIAVEITKELMSGKIMVENDQVRQVVESNINTLREAVEHHNIKLTSLEVTVDQDRPQWANRNYSDAGGYKRSDRQNNQDQDKKQRQFANEGRDDKGDTGRRMGYNSIELVA